jgi:hypothetical protein
MPKRRLTLKVRIPEYKSPRNAWRLGIHKAVIEKKEKKGIKYNSKDKLQVIIKLYLHGRKLLITDVDNRLKDILDALQGRAGGTKKIASMKKIIPNDNQIYKVTIEKMLPPKQSHGLGHLVVRKYNQRLKV